MILPVANLPSYSAYQFQNKSFTGAPSIKYKEIKNLHALTCPRCGGPIIEPQKLIGAYRTISLPLRQMLKNGYLDGNKNMKKVWELLNDFAEKYPEDSLDKILEDEKRHTLFRTAIEQTIVPNLDRNNREIYNANLHKFNSVEDGIRKSARTKLRSSSVVMKRLKSFLPYLKEIEQSEPYKTEIRGKIGALEELLYYSTLYPNKTLSEIVNEPSIRAYNEAMRNGLNEEFQHKQKLAFTEVRKTIKKRINCSDSVLNIFQKELMYAIFNSDKDPGVRLHKALELCKDFTEKNDCTNIYGKLSDIIKNIPEPPYNKYVELCNGIDKYNDAKIVDSLLKQYVGSNEHFIARSDGGEDLRQNKISMHKGCNSKRSNMPYKYYIGIYPLAPYYIGKQIEQVSENILAGRMISKYDLYPPQMAATIKDATDGLVSPDVSKYCKKALKKSTIRLEENSEKIAAIADKRDKEIKHLQKLTEEENTIRENIEAAGKEHEKAIQAQNEERRLNGWLTKYLSDKTD